MTLMHLFQVLEDLWMKSSAQDLGGITIPLLPSYPEVFIRKLLYQPAHSPLCNKIHPDNIIKQIL